MMTRDEIMATLNRGGLYGHEAIVLLASITVLAKNTQSMMWIDDLNHQQCLTLAAAIEGVQDLLDGLLPIVARRHAEVCTNPDMHKLIKVVQQGSNLLELLELLGMMPAQPDPHQIRLDLN